VPQIGPTGRAGIQLAASATTRRVRL